jgi:hypothetical protein
LSPLFLTSGFILQFKTKGGSELKEYCTNLTKEDCRRQTGSFVACDKVSVDVLVFPFLPSFRAHTTVYAITSVEISICPFKLSV